MQSTAFAARRTMLSVTPRYASRAFAGELRSRYLFAAILCIFVSSEFRALAAAEAPQKICENLYFTHSIDPDLSADEKRLACGHGGDGGGLEEWQNIPVAQRKFHLGVFLQARGYVHPKYKSYKDKVLWVDPGENLRVKRLEVRGAPDGFSYERRRKIIGEVLTPSFLDDLKNWTIERLRGLSYGCPVVDLQADSDSGVITSTIHSGPRGRIVAIEEQPVEGLLPGIFRRYDAFETGGWFNGDLLNLTEKRVLNEGQVESFKLAVDHCEDEQVFARQEVLAGKPRLLTLGAGINTEGVLLLRAQWKNLRLGKTASFLNLLVQVSGNEQTFSALMHWYVLPWVSRWYLKPVVSSSHQHYEPYEALTLRQELTAETTYDTDALGYQFGFGPVYEYVKTFRGPGLPTSRYLIFEPSFRVASHYFDFYATSPRSGFLIGLSGDLSHHELYSQIGFRQVVLHGEGLWNLKNYSPPLWVFGLRGTLASTFSGGGNAFESQLPPTFRHYLGGSVDLRGFGLYELPRDQVGRLTSAYGGFETRLVGELPVGIQPFSFVDVGAFGAREASLEPPVYWSPGIGLRAETPFGNFRLTLAHGFVTGNPDPSTSHFQVFFSYGQEF